MKHNIHFSALMGLTMMLAGAAVASCQKDPTVENNPPVVTIAGTPFTLSAEETRGDTQYVFPWTVSKTGVTDSVKEELDEMTVTSFNIITFTAKPDGEGDFPGVNVRSSNVGAVQVSMKGKTQFSLKYIGDGESTITVWNGNESDKATSVSFKVQARKTIPVEGLLVRIDDKEEITVKALDAKTWEELFDKYFKSYFYEVRYVSDEKIEHWAGMTLNDQLGFYDVSELDTHKLEILHTVPENTTWRRFWASSITRSALSEVFFEGQYDWFKKELNKQTTYGIPNGTDVSLLYGKSLYIGSRPSARKGLEGFGIPGSFRLTQKKETAQEIEVSKVKMIETNIICK